MIKVTIIESVLTEQGEDKIKGLFDVEEQEVDWDSMGLTPNDNPNEVTLDEDDYTLVELEAYIVIDEISYWHKTPKKSTTTVFLKTSKSLEVKEDLNYFVDKLNNS